MNTKKIYFGIACVLSLALGVTSRAFDNNVAAKKEAEKVAQNLHDNKQKALRSSILLAMYARGEGELGHASTPCIERHNDTSVLGMLETDDITYVCIITAHSGNVYEAEIELLTLANQFIALPAMLTLKNGEES